MLLGNNIRNSTIYRNVAKPIVKVGTGAATGFATSGGNPLGAIVGGLTSAMGNGLNDKGFNPLSNMVLPGAAGYVVGASSGGQAFNQALEAGSNPLEAAHIGVMEQLSGTPLYGGSFGSLGSSLAQGGLTSLLQGGIGGGGIAPAPYQPTGAFGGALAGGGLNTNALTGGGNNALNNNNQINDQLGTARSLRQGVAV